MARKELSEEERQQIKNTLEETRKRRKNQSIKVFELKVNCHHTSKKTYSLFTQYFKEAKWVSNDMLSFSKTSDIFKYEYIEHKTIARLDKDKNIKTENISLPSVYHRSIIKQMKTDIVNLSKAKKKGNKVGRLKYKSEVNAIPIITGFTKIKDRTHITIPSFRNLKVYGLEQLDKYQDNFEIADGKLIRKASGIYIRITVCIDKKVSKEHNKKRYKDVGLDFGIKDNIITSDGDKFNCSVQETEQLKFLQKQLHRKQEGSKRYYRLCLQIRREYERMNNRKEDASNKVISFLKKNYDTIYFQDEQIANWKKQKKSMKTGRKCFSFSRQVQNSYLGRVRADLKLLEPSGKSYMISKWLPTTKFCPNCGSLNRISLNERTYRCDCGYSFDRDIHAARNVKLFGSTKRAECLEQASAERDSSTAGKLAMLAIQMQEYLDEAKTRSCHPKGWR